MTDATIALIGDLLVAPLLAAVIYYAMRLHRRLELLRSEQKQLNELLGQFSTAAERADAATAKLKTTGVDTDKLVRALTARAESMRDELAFLIGRADHASAKIGDAARPAVAAVPKRPLPERPLPEAPEGDAEPSPVAVRSEAERDLIHAIRRASGER